MKQQIILYFLFYKISSVNLPYPEENVCLSLEPHHTLYAVGSQSHVTMLDGRCPSKHLYSVESIDKDAGDIPLQNILACYIHHLTKPKPY